jgi:FkbH-like protein
MSEAVPEAARGAVAEPGAGDAAEPSAEGDRLFRAGHHAAAVAAYERAAALFELPPGELSAKLARACLAAGDSGQAMAWALRVADSDHGFAAWSAAAKVLQRARGAGLPRLRRRLKVGLVGTWTTNAFAPLCVLALARLGIDAELYEAPFDQYFNETLEPGSALFASRPEALVLCPDHRAMGLPAFADEPAAVVAEEVARWAGVWRAARATAPLTIVQQGFALPAGDLLGHLGAGLAGARQSLAQAVNRELAVAAEAAAVGLVDVDGLAGRFGKDAWFDERSWHLAKVALAPAAMPLLARHTAAVLAARLGLSRRCLVLDLDNTLWGGVIGDDGLAGLTLGDGPDGEAFVAFQQAIKGLAGRGVVLAVCSKNDPEIAREPFLRHPEMVLGLDDIAAFVANWRPKSANLETIAKTLDLGLDTLTFVDDNPYERAEVRRALPEVDVLALPPEPTGYARALLAYPDFEPAAFTAEDRARGAQYRARAEAMSLRDGAGSLEDYQASLAMVATLGSIDETSLARVVQLINKTNQFNVTTIRRERDEVAALLLDPNVVHFWVRLRDRFADHGLIAVVIAEVAGAALVIDTLLMSCRVIGRGVEEVIRDELLEQARRRGCSVLEGRYVASPRNALVADLFPRLGFTAAEPAAAAGELRSSAATTWRLAVGALSGAHPLIRVERSTLPQAA